MVRIIALQAVDVFEGDIENELLIAQDCATWFWQCASGESQELRGSGGELASKTFFVKRLIEVN